MLIGALKELIRTYNNYWLWQINIIVTVTRPIYCSSRGVHQGDIGWKGYGSTIWPRWNGVRPDSAGLLQRSSDFPMSFYEISWSFCNGTWYYQMNLERWLWSYVKVGWNEWVLETEKQFRRCRSTKWHFYPASKMTKHFTYCSQKEQNILHLEIT